MDFLFKHRDKRRVLVEFLKQNDRLVAEAFAAHEPTLNQLLILKDKLFISDHEWSLVARTFKLKHGTIYRLKKLRKRLNNESGVTPTASGNGSQKSIVNILTNLFKANPPTSNKVRVKFAFDACRITKVGINNN